MTRQVKPLRRSSVALATALVLASLLHSGPTRQAWAQAAATSPPGLAPVQRLAPAIDPVARREALIGRWYGETGTQDGRRLQWITEREASGTYRTQYLSALADGESEESTEVGQWGLSGGVLFTLQRAWIRNGETQRADPGNVYSGDAFDLISLTERSIEYRSAGSGKRFTVRRVGPEFRFRPRSAPAAPPTGRDASAGSTP